MAKTDQYYLLISVSGMGDGSGNVTTPPSLLTICPEPPCFVIAANSVGSTFGTEIFWTSDLDAWIKSNQPRLKTLGTFSIVAISNAVV
jgi:hypothetical protein